MPVEIRELVIKASIEQKPQNAPNAQITDEMIEKIKNEIISEIMNEVKEKVDEIIYNK
jgi:hypothetical protein